MGESAGMRRSATATRFWGVFERIQARDEIFIRHHINKGDPVPFWAATEVVSLGTFPGS